MSLVNDMLRDLDQRRQEPSAANAGAERLVPVGNVPEQKRAKFSLFTFGVSIAVTLSLIMAVLYFRQSSVVDPTPSQPAFSANPAPAAPQAPLETAPVQVVGVDPEELALVTQRMQALEEENRALLVAQQAQALALEEAMSAEVIEAAPSFVAAPNAIGQASAAVDQVDAIVQENAAKAAEAVLIDSTAQEATDETVSSVIRSPRELSFADQDLLQAQDAMRLVGRNQRDLAMQELRGFLNENPNAHQSRETLIKLAIQGNDVASAQMLLDAGLAIAPSYDGFRKLQARLLLSNGRADQALALLNTRTPTVASDLEFHDLLATAYLSTQDYGNAARTYESLVQINRNEARWWYGLARSWDNLGRVRDAKLAYEQAITLPNLSASLRQRSQVRVAEIGN